MFLKPVPAPASGFLFFACPKKRNQKKRHPDAALTLRSEGFERGFPKGLPSPHEKRDASLHRPYRANPFKPSGARRGITGENPSRE